MELQSQKPRSVYINCGNLDMRDTTEETAATIRHINAGNVLVTPRTRAFLASFSVNMGNLMEVPDGAHLVTGQEILGHEAFTASGDPHPLANMGTLILKPDVSQEDIDRTWSVIVNLGRLIYPDQAGGLANKITDNKGSLCVYPSSAHLIVGDLTLDEGYLNALAAHTELVITGNLNVHQGVSDTLIDQKIASLQVMGKVTAHEEQWPALAKRFDTQGGTPEAVIIPKGYEVAEQALTISTQTLKGWSNRNIYCVERVLIRTDVTPDLLDRAIGGLISKESIVCPGGLSTVLSKKCNTLTTTVHYYEGTLWLVENELTLRASRFDFLEEKATLFVTGVVTIDPDLEPQRLFDGLAGVYNWGVLSCRPNQMGALEARMLLNEGVLNDSTPTPETEDDEKKKEDGTVTINVGNFKL